MTGLLDALVVGGGPVGLVTALHARRAGLSVAVVERRDGVIDKACGEGLMPGAVRALQTLGVSVPGHPFVGIRYVGMDGATTVAHTFSGGVGLGVRRTALHAALRDATRAAGVPVVLGRVGQVRQDGARVQAWLDGATEPVQARWLLACDGLHSPVRRLVGLDAGADGRRYGVRRHALVRPWTDHVEVHWSPVAEAYVTPVSAEEVGVAVLGPRGLDFEEALAELPALRQRLAGAAWTSSARGAGPFRRRVRGRVAGRVLLVGDAGGYVDALTGEGLRIGFASAAAAVRAVAADATGGYERAWRVITRDYRWLTSTLVTTTRNPLLRRAIVPAAARLPRLFAAAVDSLAR